MRNSTALAQSALIIAALLSTSCSLKNSTQTALHIEIPHTSKISQNSHIARTISTSSNYQTAPASLTDFDCYAVNVTAIDIPPSNPKQCSLASDMIGVPGGWVAAQSLSGSTHVDIDLMVPNGPNRLIEIYGVRTPDPCPKLGDFSSARLSDVYLLGSVTTDILDDMSVSIHAALDTSKKALTSCRGGATTTLPDVTYYVLGPTNTSTTLSLPNSAQYSLTSVGATSITGTTVTDDGTHTHFNYNPNLNTGIDQFTYTVTDTSGAQATGKIIIKNVTPFTWTGEAGDSKWSTPGNWCGSVNIAHSACVGSGTVLSTADKAIFDGTCLAANCNSNIDVSSTAINSLDMDDDYTGTLTQDPTNSYFNITNTLKIRGGTLRLNNVAGSFSAPGTVSVDGGSFISGTANISNLGTGSGVYISAGLLDLSLSSNVSLGTLSMNSGTFHAPENGLVTFNGTINYLGGTFNAGSALTANATVINNTGSAQTLTASSLLIFQNLSIFSPSLAGSITLSGNLKTLGNLSLSGMSGSSAVSMNGGSISVLGNLAVDSGFGGYSGTTNILMNGTGTQTITDASAAHYPNISVSKSGTLNINTYSAITLQSLTATNVNHNGAGSLTLPTGDIYPGTLTQNTTGVLIYPGGIIHGNLTLQTGSCDLQGTTNVLGTLTLNPGTTLNQLGHSLSQGSLVNNGTINL